ncbi:MAG: PASTA domain-containing protein, partial [Acidothermaceae bacterium]
LYELLTGNPPFTGDSPVAVAYQHVREDQIPPSRLNHDISPAIDSIVLKAMAKNPANRYQSAAEMRDDIERALAGVPVQATPLLSDQTTRLAPIADERVVRRQPRGRRTLTYILLFLLACGVFIVLGLFLRNALTSKNTVTNVKVQPVTNLTQDAAVQALQNAHLDPVVKQGASASVKKGVVFDQNPPAGTPLPPNSKVTITVSGGPQAVQVPDLTNKLLADASTALEQAKLKLGRQTPQDSQLPPGTVISQIPKPGDTANQGSAVDVVVASGTGTVPDVRNIPVDQAEQTLTQNGYSFHVTEQPNSSVPPGSVINQSPNHDSKAKIGSTVELFVATAPVVSSPPVQSPPASSPPASPTAAASP